MPLHVAPYRWAMSVGALRLGFVRVCHITRPRLGQNFSVAARATPTTGDGFATMPEQMTVASTRVANYALGSKILNGASEVSVGKPAQLVLHADWVTCTQ